MRSVMMSAFLVLALSLSVEAQAGVQMPCAAFGRICGCPSFVRDCLPTCHLQPQIECTPTHWTVERR